MPPLGFSIYAAASRPSPRPLPRIIYSRKRADVRPVEVAKLLYSCGLTDSVDVSRTKRSLGKCLTLVAVFTPCLPGKRKVCSEGSLTLLTEGSQDDYVDGKTLPWPPGFSFKKSKRCLIGFGQCGGDASLVATMHNVAVHPDYQGIGIGSNIIKRLLAQASSMGICEVGAVMPHHLQDFFSRCGFGQDSEMTLLMKYNRSKPKRLQRPSKSLKRLLQGGR